MAQEIQEQTGPVKQPYIIFERIVNKGRKERKDSKTGQVLQLGEHKQKWKCVLANSIGELHTWATVLGVQHYISKGYVPLELHGFEEYFQRKSQNQDMVQELIALYHMLSRSVAETGRLRKLEEENAALRAELAEALKLSDNPALKERLAELEAQAKEKDALAEQMKKLQDEMLAQSKELEEARKAAAEKKAKEEKGGK